MSAPRTDVGDAQAGPAREGDLDFSPPGPAAGQIANATAFLDLIREPARLQILLLLSEGPRSIGKLTDALGSTQPEIVHHLARLRHGGLVVLSRVGQDRICRLTEAGSRTVGLILSVGSGRKPRGRSAAKDVRLDPALLDEVRGLVDDPETWLTTPNPVFAGRPPVDLIGTDDEWQLRNRIEMAKHGMFS